LKAIASLEKDDSIVLPDISRYTIRNNGSMVILSELGVEG